MEIENQKVYLSKQKFVFSPATDCVGALSGPWNGCRPDRIVHCAGRYAGIGGVRHCSGQNTSFQVSCCRTPNIPTSMRNSRFRNFFPQRNNAGRLFIHDDWHVDLCVHSIDRTHFGGLRYVFSIGVFYGLARSTFYHILKTVFFVALFPVSSWLDTCQLDLNLPRNWRTPNRRERPVDC